jgi:hypothetical protein
MASAPQTVDFDRTILYPVHRRGQGILWLDDAKGVGDRNTATQFRGILSRMKSCHLAHAHIALAAQLR